MISLRKPSRYTLLFLCLFGLFALQNCKSPDPLLTDQYIIDNVTVIDPINGDQGKRHLLIHDNQIALISKASITDEYPNTKIIDASGKYVMPGLWDAHIHFDYDKLVAPKMLDLFLGYGITYVRDTGGQIDIVKAWKEKAQSDPSRYPMVKIAGPLIDGKDNVYDGHSPKAPPLSVQSKDTSDIRKIVESLVQNDVDLLKAYEMLTPDQFAYLMQLAKKYGLKVTGHVPLSMTVSQAADLGFNSMEHFRNIELSCSYEREQLLDQRQSLLKNKDEIEGYVLRSNIHTAQRIRAIETNDESMTDEVLTSLKKNDTWQIPTLTLYAALADRPYLDGIWSESYEYLPDTVKNSWTARIKEMVSKPVTESLQQQVDWYSHIFSKVYEKEIPFMVGTDCPIYFLTPGMSLHEELRHMVRCGMQPIEAIQAATTNPALYFDMENEIGRVKQNYIADLIILDKNPLDDIKNTLTIHAVIKNGKYWSKSELEKILSSSSEEG